MRSLKISCLLALTLLLVLSLSLLAPPAHAHGGGQLQLASEAVGPYLLSVWTNPDPAIVGAMHVTVGLALAESGAAVVEPTVTLSAAPTDGSAPAQTAVAGHEQALTPYFYEADLDFTSEGAWEIVIEIEGKEGGGSASLLLDVQRQALDVFKLGLAGIMIVVIAWLGWMLMQGRGQRKGSRTSTKA